MIEEPTIRQLQAVAKKLARHCRHVIQGVLREEEWLDADHEFQAIILAGLKELIQNSGTPGVGREMAGIEPPDL